MTNPLETTARRSDAHRGPQPNAASFGKITELPVNMIKFACTLAVILVVEIGEVCS
jgi:hypothetical protein